MRGDVEAALRGLGGCARRGALLQCVSPHALRRAVAEGEVVRRARDVYVLPEGSVRGEAMAVGGLISHGTAAAHWMLDQLEPPDRLHVTVRRGTRRAPRRGVALHYSDVPAADEHGCATSPLRTVLDCAGTLPFREGLAIADSALRRELITGGELREAADRRTGPGAGRQRRVAAAADGLAANPLESGLRAAVIEAGVTGFRPQVEVAAGSSRYRVDLGDERRRIALEADSFTFHGTPAALERDCRRYDELVRAGWLVLRFAWAQVMDEPGWVGEVVRDTCARAGQKRMVA